MARSERKLKTITLNAGDNELDSFDITNYSGCAVGIRGPANGAGTLKLQASMNNEDWFDVPLASIAIANGVAMIQTNLQHCGFIRPHANISAGAGEYQFWYLAKDF